MKALLDAFELKIGGGYDIVGNVKSYPGVFQGNLHLYLSKPYPCPGVQVSQVQVMGFTNPCGIFIVIIIIYKFYYLQCSSSLKVHANDEEGYTHLATSNLE